MDGGKTDVQGHLKKIVSLTFWSKGCHEEIKDVSAGVLQQRHSVPPGSYKASLNSVTELIPTGLLLSRTNTQISPPPCLVHSQPLAPPVYPGPLTSSTVLCCSFSFLLPFVLWDGEWKKGKRGGWGGGEGKERDLWLAFRWFHMKRQHTPKLPPPVTHSVSLASVE